MTLDLTILTRPCTIEHVVATGTPDDYGTPTDTVTTTDTTCELQQRQRSEDQNLAEIGQETWLLVLGPDIGITTYDRVVIDGLGYELVGPPWYVRHPRQESMSHIEATVRRTQ